MNKSIKDITIDVFGRPVNKQNENLLYGSDGKLKQFLKQKEFKINQLEKPMIKKKDKKDKFL